MDFADSVRASSMDFIKAMLFPDVPYPDLEEQLERIPLGCDGRFSSIY